MYEMKRLLAKSITKAFYFPSHTIEIYNMAMEQAYQELCVSIDEVYSKLDSSDEIGGKLKNRLQEAFHNPPLDHIITLTDTQVTAEQVQQLLFAPKVYDAGLYSSALWKCANSSILKTEPALQKTYALLLALIYLHHRKNNNFILGLIGAGGLRALTMMFSSDNLYERSQAIETFLSAINTDLYDWFLDPLTEQDVRMHCDMLQLGTDYQLMGRAVANRSQSYPGGSFRALQIIAFWLSWCRMRYPDIVGSFLTQDLKSELEAWKSTPMPQDGQNTQDIDEQEMQLASILYDDFYKSQLPLPPSVPERVEEEIWLPPPPPQSLSCAELKEQGSSLFKVGQYVDATIKYESALSLVGEDRALEAILRVNLSNTYWKLAQINTEARETLLLQIIEHCKLALIADPQSHKAMYRLVSTYLDQGKTAEAWSLLQPKVEGRILGNYTHDSKANEFAASLQKLAYRCLSKEILNSPPNLSNPFKSTSAKASSLMYNKVFNSLMQRNKT